VDHNYFIIEFPFFALPDSQGVAQLKSSYTQFNAESKYTSKVYDTPKDLT
jgi:hypothetical protein